MAALACLGRHTMSGVISTAGKQWNDWSADYRVVSRQRFDRRRLFESIVRHVETALEPASPLEIAIDDTTLKKTGRKVHGAQWRADRMGPKFQTNLLWGQRFIQFSAVLPEAAHRASPACMVPVEFLHCPGPAKLTKDATAAMQKEHRERARQAALPQRAIDALAHLRETVDPQRMIISTADGGYTNRTTLKGLPPGTTFIGRIRKDAKLFARPIVQPGTGRRRSYGLRLPTPDEIRADETVAWEPVEIYVGGQVRTLEVKTQTARWKPAGGRDLKLVVIRPLKYKLTTNGRTLYRDPVFLIATDSQMETQQLVQSYVRRWGIEQNFRDEKQVIGVDQNYMRTPASVQAMPALLVASYAMLRLACRKAGSSALARPKWQRPRSPNTLTANREIALLRQSLWSRALQRGSPGFDSFASPPTSNPKPPKLQNTLAHAVIYASRC